MNFRILSHATFLLILSLPTLLIAQRLEIDSLLYNDSFRKVRVYIPSSTDNFSGRKVIYMLDAQNLFDSDTSYAGEWEVDEAIENLKTKHKPIIIGIDHGNEERIDELTPYSHEKYGGGQADEFLNFVSDQVIPFIESKYSFEHARDKTLIAGSSLGGLFAHYAILSRPEIFSAAGIFSPSYWFSNEIYKDSKHAKFKKPTTIFMSGGDAESKDLVEEMKRMKIILDTKQNINIEMIVIPDAEHNEKQWRETFPLFLKNLDL